MALKYLGNFRKSLKYLNKLLEKIVEIFIKFRKPTSTCLENSVKFFVQFYVKFSSKEILVYIKFEKYRFVC